MRLGPKGLLTYEQILAAHHLHWEEGVSIGELSRRGWKAWGYKSPESASRSLRNAFTQTGLEIREASDAVRLRHSQRGNTAKQRYERKRCIGETKKGRACKKFAPHNSDYCWAHDPQYEERRKAIGQEHLPKAWAMQQRDRELSAV